MDALEKEARENPERFLEWLNHPTTQTLKPYLEQHLEELRIFYENVDTSVERNRWIAERSRGMIIKLRQLIAEIFEDYKKKALGEDEEAEEEENAEEED